MKISQSVLALAVAGALVPAAQAASYTLDFSTPAACGGPCFADQMTGSSSNITGSYGDTVGIDVGSYWYFDSNPNVGAELNWWDTGYSTLDQVAWVGDTTGTQASTGYIFVDPGSSAVSITSFDMAVYDGYSVSGSWSLIDFNSNVLDSGTFSSGLTHVTSTASSTNGIVLLWTAGTGTALVGVDNVSYTVGTVSSVPETGTYAMFLAGLGLMGAMARRRTVRK